MVDSVRSSQMLAQQIQTTQDSTSTRRLQTGATPKESGNDKSVRDRNSDSGSTANMSSTKSTATATPAPSQESSEDLRERAKQLMEARSAGGTNTGTSSIRRGSLLDITA